MENEQRFYTEIFAGTSSRQQVLLAITQPVTATQLSRRLRISLDRCSNALLQLHSHKLVRCLNPTANRNRLFWLTRAGMSCQRHLEHGTSFSYCFPDIDWELYATICFSHRSEVIRTITHTMQPSEIKRRAAFRRPGLTMSANNVRDVIGYLKAKGIVRPVTIRKKAHPRYELTEIGLHMRRLLLQVEVER